MNIIWLGHASFRIEIGDQVLLVDPWLTGNPMFPPERRAEAVAGTTAVLVSHGHSDHLSDAVAIAQEFDAPLLGKYDLTSWLTRSNELKVVGFNNGGTVAVGNVAVTMVAASHSSSAAGPDGPVYVGSEAGYMIEHDGRVIYYSGDTDVMADMAIFAELHNPEVGILSAGGHFTMDMKRAAYAVRKFFHFRTVIPCHYKTFPLLEQSADDLRAGVSSHVKVVEPEVLVAIKL